MKLSGILPARQRQNAHVAILLQQKRQRPLRRRLPRRVGIVVHDDAPREPPQQLHLRLRQAGAATRHHVADPRPRHRDRIHIAFHQNRRVRLPYGFFGAIQVIEHGALDIDRRLRRIQILRQVVSQRSPAERHHFARFVGDRENDAPAEAVVSAPVGDRGWRGRPLRSASPDISPSDAAAARRRPKARSPIRTARSPRASSPRSAR